MGLNVGYYDKILMAIAACLLLGLIAGLITPLEVHVAIFLGSLGATVFVYLGVFSNPPLPRPRREVTTAVVLWHVLLLLYGALFFV